MRSMLWIQEVNALTVVRKRHLKSWGGRKDEHAVLAALTFLPHDCLLAAQIDTPRQKLIL